ncbi:MAG: glutamate--cysteine ligase [Pseudomonadota bacterium]
MGQNIYHQHFSAKDFLLHKQKISTEFSHLENWFKKQPLENQQQIPTQVLKAGFELEVYLVDNNHLPCAENKQFLQQLQHPSVIAELANFNVEINSSVREVKNNIFSDFEKELKHIWALCQKTASRKNQSVCMTGILPSLEKKHLTIDNMSKLKRYHAINEQILKTRQGKTIHLDICGKDSLHVQQHDVMLEAVTTSLQLHLQLPFAQATRYYNSAIILSAPLVAICANSPFLFGKDLWQETRIPAFEQSIASGGYAGAAFGPIKRAGFGEAYVKQSLLECFAENIEHYPILLAELFPDPKEKLSHLLLHNGTIWRWTRPLIGLEKDGQYHLRLEHRSMPAGPSIVDCIANAALFYGILHSLASQYKIAEQHLPFNLAKDNFYTAAKFGLDCKIHWLDNNKISIKKLFMQQLLPMAKDGLSSLGVARSDIDYYLNIIQQRLNTQQTGAIWQQNYLQKHHCNMQQLVKAYINRQQSGKAVYEWEI